MIFFGDADGFVEIGNISHMTQHSNACIAKEHNHSLVTSFSIYRKKDENYPVLNYGTSFISSVAAYPSSISLDFLPNSADVIIRVEATSNQAQGLVCCLTYEPVLDHIPRYYVCKPLTRQWTQIPTPITHDLTKRMAIVIKKSHPLHYKIIRLSWSSMKTRQIFHCEIFDSKNWEWTMYSKSMEYKDYTRLSISPEIFLHGSFHWFINFEVDDHRKEMLSFDVEKGNWSLYSLPQSQEEVKEAIIRDIKISLRPQEKVEVNCDLNVVNCEGNLGVLYHVSRLWMELWVMEDYLNKSWKKKFKVRLEPLKQIVGEYFVLAMDSMDMMLLRNGDKLISYNYTNGILTQVMKIEDLNICNPIFQFNSDNVDCYLGPPPKEYSTEEEKKENQEQGIILA
ncbi:hypothetical protein NE237_028138 [Protea cynaroides]|uniref:F-box associated beta-propeller type 1 domain-containing protein n=1 Tax=Protea cynaroides TaxID=273540 RepID=A0A9Q0GNU7_9MAGN|nr:hypothetical protein NE237_028138 [Protea cynaroides]